MCRQLICLVCLALALTLTACNDGLNTSSVPSAPVQITVNMSEWEFVHFRPGNIGAVMTVDKSGFHLNGKTYNLRPTDYYGYRGLVVIVDNNGEHSAFDLCCPNCVYDSKGVVQVDGCFARCPICGEEYDLSWGYGNPQQGVARENLKKYTCLYSGDRLTIRR